MAGWEVGGQAWEGGRLQEDVVMQWCSGASHRGCQSLSTVRRLCMREVVAPPLWCHADLEGSLLRKGSGTRKLEHEGGAEGASISRQPRESDWNLNTMRRVARRAQLAAERWCPR